MQFRRRSSAESSATFFEKALNGLSTQRSRSRSKSPSIVEQPEASDHARGPLGLNLLYSPSESLVDFVFVHGLGGGSRKTWSKTDNPYHYWPKEWLPRDPDFSNCRICSFGYASDWSERRDRVLEINDFAASLLGEIKNDPGIRASEVRSWRSLNLETLLTILTQTRIVLVGHSMGGLVIKQVKIPTRWEREPHTN